MTKTFMEEKLAIFEPFMGRDVKIKVTIVEPGIYAHPLQIVVLAGRLIGVEANIAEAELNVVLDTMQVSGGGDPLPLNYSDTPHPRVEIEELFEDIRIRNVEDEGDDV